MQISRDVQVTVGENVLLRCLINKPVMRCEWSWRSTDSNNNHSVTRRFPPNGEAENDCSLRFKNVMYDEEGYWTCGVRLTLNGTLLEAQRTTLALLPSGWFLTKIHANSLRLRMPKQRCFFFFEFQEKSISRKFPRVSLQQSAAMSDWVA